MTLTAFLFWPSAGFLSYLIISMWLGAADKAPMSLQIIGGLTLLCAAVLLVLPIYCYLFVVSPMAAVSAGSGRKGSSEAQDESESFADESFGEDEVSEVDEDEDLDAQATNEFETLEFSGDDFEDFSDDFALDDDDEFK